MAFKATKYFVLILALVIGGTRYMNSNMKRHNLNNDVGVWDSKAKDGHRFTVITRASETGGQYWVVNILCMPKAKGFYKDLPCSPPGHIHVSQTEEFQAIRGTMMFDVNGTKVQLPVGEVAAVPAGVPHYYWNAGDDPIEFSVRFTPGYPDESFFENMGGLSQQYDGSLSNVNPIQLVVLFVEHGLVPVDVPPLLWDAATKILVPLGKLMGFKGRYPEYTSKAAAQQDLAAAAAPQAVESPAAEAAEPLPEAVAEEAGSAETAAPAAADQPDHAEL